MRVTQPPASRRPGPPQQRLGVGLGLRWAFIDEVIAALDSVEGAAPDGERLDLGVIPFFEIAPENYMRRGGRLSDKLLRVAEHYPMITHGLQMSLGGVDPFSDRYFEQVRAIQDRFDIPWHSDHLCFCGTEGKILHDLLPVPQTEAAAHHVAARVREASDRLGRPMAVENISYYLRLGKPDLSEPEFLSIVLEEADCPLMLDVNNVYVNSVNHGFDPYEWLEKIDLSRVVQMHVAGHEYDEDDDVIVDTHGADVPDPVYSLLTWVIARTGPKPVVLERDNTIPPLRQLLDERQRLQDAYDAGLKQFHGAS